jgi:ketosteroid isomerase-like protein
VVTELPSPAAAWHALVRSRDPRALDAMLDDDVVLHSPVVHTPVAGKPIVRKYLMAALQVFANDSFRYVREFESANQVVLEFETVVDGLTVNGVDMIRWNEAGRIVDFKVMVRPLKAVNLIHQKMGELLAARAAPGGE